MAVERAAAMSSFYRNLDLVDVSNMTFEVVSSEEMTLGSDMVFLMRVTNSANSERKVNVMATVTSVQYTGLAAVNNIYQQPTTVSIRPFSCNETKLRIPYKDYQESLSEFCIFRLFVLWFVVETNQYHCQTHDIQLVKPSLKIKLPETVNVGEQFELEVNFTNPLPKTLNCCEIIVDAHNLSQHPVTHCHESIRQHAQCKLITRLNATQTGIKQIVVTFYSTELYDVAGSAFINVV
jgi:hypothetical protein